MSRSPTLARLRGMPVVGGLLKARYERLFATPHGASCLSGSYLSFAAAASVAPASMTQGYDLAAAGELYENRMYAVLLKDYPALYWMRRWLPNARRIFDIGGHVGLMYYAYAKYLAYPADMTWTVCDVPAVVARGQALARERGQTQLTFTTALGDVVGSDLVLATGSLQYIETPLAAQLGALRDRPPYVIINETPTHRAPELITLQNIGVSICPYRIANHDDIPRQMMAIGYELVDSWDDPVRRTEIPFVTSPAAIAYSGFAFRLANHAHA
jgi:putative methyltransferase (TIGR04325 family)